MPNYSKLAATSEAVGLQYYKVLSFSFTKAAVSLPIVSGGVYHHDTSTFSLPKNPDNIALTSQILTNVLMNISVSDAAGAYELANGGTGATIFKGSSGGFPVFYQYAVYISSDANNIYFTIDVGNGSAVNAVTSDAITISGKVFLYLAPF